MLEHLEASGLSTFLRESPSLLAFPFVLILHTLGMALLAGISAAIGLRLLGIAPAIPIPVLRSFVPYAWVGFALNAVSGVLLVIAYPTKALTNPVFYVKLALIGLSLSLLVLVDRRYLRPAAVGAGSGLQRRMLGALTIAGFALTIVAGRLLPYTYRHLFSWS